MIVTKSDYDEKDTALFVGKKKDLVALFKAIIARINSNGELSLRSLVVNKVEHNTGLGPAGTGHNLWMKFYVLKGKRVILEVTIKPGKTDVKKTRPRKDLIVSLVKIKGFNITWAVKRYQKKPLFTLSAPLRDYLKSESDKEFGQKVWALVNEEKSNFEKVLGSEVVNSTSGV